MDDVVWDLVSTERRALVADLSSLTPEQWESPSLAAGWSVHDVAAHLADNALTTPLGLLRAMVRARGDFDRQNDDGLRRAKGDTPAETLERLAALVDRRTGPPTWLAAVKSRLVEEVAHGEDIRGALGIRRAYPVEVLLPAIEYQARTKDSFGGGKTLADAVTLVADDAELRRGAGPELRGPALALLLALTGRAQAADALSGPGRVHVRA